MTEGSSPSAETHASATPERASPGTQPAGRSRGSKALLASLIMAAVIPVLLFGGWTAYVTAIDDRTLARRAVAHTVDQVARRLEAALRQEMEVAETLALSGTLDAPDVQGFYREASRVVEARALWESISLARPDGQRIVDAIKPHDERRAPLLDQDSFKQAVRARRTVIGGMSTIGASAEQVVPLQVPVLRNEALRYMLTVGIRPDQITTILRNAGAPPGWVGAVVDARGQIVARTHLEDGAVGQLASASQRDTAIRQDSGSYRGSTLEGIEVETFYEAISGSSDWSVHFGIPSAALDRPVARSVGLLIGGGVGSIALAIALGSIIAREVAQRRREETARSAAALEMSEQRRTLAVEAARLGTWSWDMSAGTLTGSERFGILVGLSGIEIGRQRWTEEEFLEAVYPADRTSLQAFGRRCVSSGESLDVEFRISAGGERWRRAVGRAVTDDDGAGIHVIHGVLADIDQRKQAETERTELQRRLAATQEAEQRRIARELHDQVGQTVTGLSLSLKALESSPEAKSTQVQEQVRWLQQLTGRISRELHQVATDLRPAALDDFGLFASLEAFVAEWSSRYGIPVDLQILGESTRLPSDIETVLFRVVQEALTNVLKHADASSVSLIFERRAAAVTAVVEDNGRGFDSEIRDGGVKVWSGGLGLSGMRERLALVGGKMSIESTPGSGTTIFVQIPLP